jgi:hypothetical protein
VQPHLVGKDAQEVDTEPAAPDEVVEKPLRDTLVSCAGSAIRFGDATTTQWSSSAPVMFEMSRWYVPFGADRRSLVMNWHRLP